MPAVKSLDRIARKWIANSGMAGAEYEAGVRAPKTPWAGAAVAAGALYRQAVTEAAGRGAFEAGVSAAGEGKWQSRAIALGPGRFAQGVQVAEPDFRAGFGPIRQAIEATTLPAKGPKGSPANVQRFTTQRDALIAAGRARRGGGRR
jgi:hypothetical protein